jgi:hypothetical protein
MINRVRLLALLCAAVFLVGCGPSRGSSNVNDRFGAFNRIEDELNQARNNINHEKYRGQYDPVEDQLGSAISYLRDNENITAEMREQAEELFKLEKYIHDVYNGPDASKENLLAVLDEMQVIVDSLKEQL